MGSVTYVCALSGLPIGWNTRVRLLALVEGERYRVDYTGKVWWPCALPIRARYNDYQTVEKIEEGPVAEAFFQGLDARILERPEDEYEPAVTKGMEREDFLHALREDRLQLYGPDKAILGVTQTMVREDIWQFFIEKSDPRLRNFEPYAVQHALRQWTLIPREHLKDPQMLEACRELIAINWTMHELSIQWMKGRTGLQDKGWELHQALARKCYRIAKRKAQADEYVEEWHDGELTDPLPAPKIPSCPVCGATDPKFDVQEKPGRISIPYAPDALFSEQVYTCGKCIESGDFALVNDARIQAAVSKAAQASVPSMVRYLGEVGYNPAAIARILQLPQGLIESWELHGAPPEGIALLRVLRTYPWLLNVADHGFERSSADVQLEKALEALREPLRERRKQDAEKIREEIEVAQALYEDCHTLCLKVLEGHSWAIDELRLMFPEEGREPYDVRELRDLYARCIEACKATLDGEPGALELFRTALATVIAPTVTLQP